MLIICFRVRFASCTAYLVHPIPSQVTMEQTPDCNTLYPAVDLLQRDDALTKLLSSVGAYAAESIGSDRTRAENVAKVYLAFCLGLQEAGVLKIEYAPHLWIDVGDTSFKVSTAVRCGCRMPILSADLPSARQFCSKHRSLIRIFSPLF